MTLVKRLSDLKQNIEDKKAKKQRLQGRREQLITILKKEFKIEKFSIAKEKLQAMTKKIKKDKSILEKEVEKLEEKFPW